MDAVILDDGIRKIPIPQNRLSPLKKEWLSIYEPIVSQLKLQIRFNPKTKNVEIKNSPETTNASYLQKATEFLKAYSLGFSVKDAIAMLRVEDMFLDSFHVKDVKNLNGEHLARAIGRLAGKNGKTRVAIENASKTRVVIADANIHILGSYSNIRIAKDAVMNLILGSTPGKVYNKLRNTVSRIKERGSF
jgi:RNA-binding protein PNO1